MKGVDAEKQEDRAVTFGMGVPVVWRESLAEFRVAVKILWRERESGAEEEDAGLPGNYRVPTPRNHMIYNNV